jgi:RimJ/RimL family protein N-acetyltransferase
MITLERQVEVVPNQTTLVAEVVSPANREVFSDVLLNSYTESKDFPELNGHREARRILESYVHTDPWPWLLFRENGHPAGVVVLGPGSVNSTAELNYMGLVPLFRGRGLGAELLARAHQEAQRLGAQRLEVQVDERNHPALRLYQRAGFRECGTCGVYLRVGLH